MMMNQDTGRRWSLIRLRLVSTGKYLSRPVVAALLVAFIDFFGLFLFRGFVDVSTLVLLLFLEAGGELLAGVGISLSSTPSISKVGQAVLGTAPWSRNAEKHAERVGLKWMVTSVFLFLIGILLSVA